MKKNNNNKSLNSIKNKRIKKISLIAWTLIQNNIVSEMLFFVFILLDFAIQTVLLMSIYEYLNPQPLNTQKVIQYITLDEYKHANFIQLLFSFLYCLAIIITMVGLYYRNDKKSILQQKNLAIKITSLMMALLRSFVCTYVTIVLTTCIYSIQDDDYIFKLVEIFLICSVMIMTAAIQYYSSCLFNLSIPNQFIPWSETQNLPFILECGFKFFLSLNFNFREEILWKTVMLLLCFVFQTYKIYLRITKSVMFRRSIQILQLISDGLILHFTILLFPQYGVDDYHYFYTILSVCPVTVILIFALRTLYQKKQLINNIDSLEKEHDKIIAYFQIIRLFVKVKEPQNQNILSQIYSFHALACYGFNQEIRHKLSKKHRKKQEKIGKTELQNLISNPDDQFQQQMPDESKIFQERTSMYSQGFNLQSLYMNGNSVYTEENFNNLLYTENDSLNSLKKKSTQMKHNSVFSTTQTQKNTIFQKKSHQSLYQSKDHKQAVGKIYQQKSVEKKRKNFKSMIKHLVKYHLINENIKDYRVVLIRIYFTIKILKNYHLAHFLIHTFYQQISRETFITKNQIFLHLHHFQNKLNSKNQKGSEFSKLNLTQILELNQLLAKFESKLDETSEIIMKFWQQLMNEKSDYRIYTKGLQISQNCLSIQSLHDEIERKQGDYREIKFYLQMANFYKNVVFKQNEYINEINKSIQIEHLRKIASIKTQMQDNTIEKGLVIAQLTLKKPMKVEFINKKCSKLLEYSQSEAVNMKINQLMPLIIGENHHRFVERFMSTGKHGMINQKRQQFVKQKSGFIIPVWTYLIINYQDINSMVLIVEQNEEFKLFEQQDSPLSIEGHLLCNEDFQVMEISRNISYFFKMNPNYFQQMKENNGSYPFLETFFKLINSKELKESLQQGINEFTVVFLPDSVQQITNQGEDEEERKEAYPIIQVEDSFQQTSQKFRFSLKGMSYTDIDSSFNNVFQMKIEQVTYLDKQLQFLVVALSPPQQENNATITQKGKLITNDNDEQSVWKSSPDQVYERKNSSGVHSQNHNILQIDGGSFDLSSMSSGDSSNISASEKFNQYFSQINSRKLPMTIKLVLQIVLIVMTITLATSTVAQILTQSNFVDATNGIKYSNLSITRMNSITYNRLLMKLMMYVAQGYSLNNNTILAKRAEFYTEVAEYEMNKLQTLESELQQISDNINAQIGDIDIYYLDAKNQVYSEKRSLEQATLLYFATGVSINLKIQEFGKDILKSNLRYFNISGLKNATAANEIERDAFFIVENGNQDLYTNIQNFNLMFIEDTNQQINKKITFQTAMTWICIGIIILSGGIIVPLFGRIQNRILTLMKIFFAIPKDIKVQMIQRIQRFKSVFVTSIEHEESSQNQNQTVKNFKIIRDIKTEDTKKNKKKSIKNGKKINSSMVGLTKQGKNDMENSISIDILEHEIQQNLEEELEEEENKKENNSEQAKPVNLEEQALQTIKYFNNFVNKKKIFQSIFIIILVLLFSGYFLGTYFLSVGIFSSMQQALEVMKLLLLRKPCVENVLHAVRETLIFNDRLMINGHQDEIYSYNMNKCQQLEKDYDKKVRKASYSFLSDAQDFIDMLEKGTFCDYAFADGIDGFPHGEGHLHIKMVDVERCKSFANGLATTGFTNVIQIIYQIAYQVYAIYESEYDKNNGTLTKAFVIENLRKFDQYFDLLEVVYTKPLQILQTQIIESMDSYFESQSVIFILIFCLFTLICLFVISLFLYYILRKLKHEMLLSNRLLYIIDLESLNEADRNNIANFLSRY